MVNAMPSAGLPSVPQGAEENDGSLLDYQLESGFPRSARDEVAATEDSPVSSNINWDNIDWSEVFRHSPSAAEAIRNTDQRQVLPAEEDDEGNREELYDEDPLDTTSDSDEGNYPLQLSHTGAAETRRVAYAPLSYLHPKGLGSEVNSHYASAGSDSEANTPYSFATSDSELDTPASRPLSMNGYHHATSNRFTGNLGQCPENDPAEPMTLAELRKLHLDVFRSPALSSAGLTDAWPGNHQDLAGISPYLPHLPAITFPIPEGVYTRSLAASFGSEAGTVPFFVCTPCCSVD